MRRFIYIGYFVIGFFLGLYFVRPTTLFQWWKVLTWCPMWPFYIFPAIAERRRRNMEIDQEVEDAVGPRRR